MPGKPPGGKEKGMGKMRGNPLFAKSRIPPHPFRQKLLHMAGDRPNGVFQSAAGWMHTA